MEDYAISSVQIAKLVLGYLKQESVGAYQEFLQTSDELAVARKQKHFTCRVMGKTLKNILYEYSKIYAIVQAHLDDEYFESRGQAGNLVNELLFLLERLEARSPRPYSRCSTPVGDNREQHDAHFVTDDEEMRSDVVSTSANNEMSTPSKQMHENALQEFHKTLLEDRELQQKLASNINSVRLEEPTRLEKNHTDNVFDSLMAEVLDNVFQPGNTSAKLDKSTNTASERLSDEEAIAQQNNVAIESIIQAAARNDVSTITTPPPNATLNQKLTVNTSGSDLVVYNNYHRTPGGLLMVQPPVGTQYSTHYVANSQPVEVVSINGSPFVAHKTSQSTAMTTYQVLSKQDIMAMPVIVDSTTSVTDQAVVAVPLLPKTSKTLPPKKQIEPPPPPPSPSLPHTQAQPTPGTSVQQVLEHSQNEFLTIYGLDGTLIHAVPETSTTTTITTHHQEQQSQPTTTTTTTTALDIDAIISGTDNQMDVTQTPQPASQDERPPTTTPKSVSKSHVRALDFKFGSSPSQQIEATVNSEEDRPPSTATTSKSVKSLFPKTPKSKLWDTDIRALIGEQPSETESTPSTSSKAKTKRSSTSSEAKQPTKGKKLTPTSDGGKKRAAKVKKVKVAAELLKNDAAVKHAETESTGKVDGPNSITLINLNKKVTYNKKCNMGLNLAALNTIQKETNRTAKAKKEFRTFDIVVDTGEKVILSPSTLPNANKRMLVDNVTVENCPDQPGPITPTEQKVPLVGVPSMDVQRAIDFSLITPCKDIINPRVVTFSPINVNDTPMTKTIKEHLDGVDINAFPTPNFPLTPNFSLTPDNQPSTSGFTNRGTDYSTSSSYYQPSDSEQNRSLEQAIIDECKRLEHGKKMEEVVVSENSNSVIADKMKSFTTQVIGKKNLSLVKKKQIASCEVSDMSSSSSSSSSSDEDATSDSEEEEETTVVETKRYPLRNRTPLHQPPQTPGKDADSIKSILQQTDFKPQLKRTSRSVAASSANSEVLSELEEKRKRTIARMKQESKWTTASNRTTAKRTLRSNAAVATAVATASSAPISKKKSGDVEPMDVVQVEMSDDSSQAVSNIENVLKEIKVRSANKVATTALRQVRRKHRNPFDTNLFKAKQTKSQTSASSETNSSLNIAQELKNADEVISDMELQTTVIEASKNSDNTDNNEEDLVFDAKTNQRKDSAKTSRKDEEPAKCDIKLHLDAGDVTNSEKEADKTMQYKEHILFASKDPESKAESSQTGAHILVETPIDDHFNTKQNQESDTNIYAEGESVSEMDDAKQKQSKGAKSDKKSSNSDSNIQLEVKNTSIPEMGAAKVEQHKGHSTSVSKEMKCDEKSSKSDTNIQLEDENGSKTEKDMVKTIQCKELKTLIGECNELTQCDTNIPLEGENVSETSENDVAKTKQCKEVNTATTSKLTKSNKESDLNMYMESENVSKITEKDEAKIKQCKSRSTSDSKDARRDEKLSKSDTNVHVSKTIEKPFVKPDQSKELNTCASQSRKTDKELPKRDKTVNIQRQKVSKTSEKDAAKTNQSKEVNISISKASRSDKHSEKEERVGKSDEKLPKRDTNIHLGDMSKSKKESAKTKHFKVFNTAFTRLSESDEESSDSDEESSDSDASGVNVSVIDKDVAKRKELNTGALKSRKNDEELSKRDKTVNIKGEKVSKTSEKDAVKTNQSKEVNISISKAAKSDKNSVKEKRVWKSDEKPSKRDTNIHLGDMSKSQKESAKTKQLSESDKESSGRDLSERKQSKECSTSGAIKAMKSAEERDHFMIEAERDVGTKKQSKELNAAVSKAAQSDTKISKTEKDAAKLVHHKIHSTSTSKEVKCDEKPSKSDQKQHKDRNIAASKVDKIEENPSKSDQKQHKDRNTSTSKMDKTDEKSSKRDQKQHKDRNTSASKVHRTDESPSKSDQKQPKDTAASKVEKPDEKPLTDKTSSVSEDEKDAVKTTQCKNSTKGERESPTDNNTRQSRRLKELSASEKTKSNKKSSKSDKSSHSKGKSVSKSAKEAAKIKQSKDNKTKSKSATKIPSKSAKNATKTDDVFKDLPSEKESSTAKAFSLFAQLHDPTSAYLFETLSLLPNNSLSLPPPDIYDNFVDSNEPMRIGNTEKLSIDSKKQVHVDVKEQFSIDIKEQLHVESNVRHNVDSNEQLRVDTNEQLRADSDAQLHIVTDDQLPSDEQQHQVVQEEIPTFDVQDFPCETLRISHDENHLRRVTYDRALFDKHISGNVYIESLDVEVEKQMSFTPFVDLFEFLSTEKSIETLSSKKRSDIKVLSNVELSPMKLDGSTMLDVTDNSIFDATTSETTGCKRKLEMEELYPKKRKTDKEFLKGLDINYVLDKIHYKE